jgi:hypothetical protein
MQPESSDGFASVGTILPKEEAALLPGGLFASAGPIGTPKFPPRLMERRSSVDSREMGLTAQVNRPQETPMHDAIVALVFIAMLMAPCFIALTSSPDRPSSN